MALLLDVSPLTVSNWETEKTSPSGKNKLAFAELRTRGVRDVREWLERLEGN
jgi:DNA-binding transcriptional regulator YiaG